MSLGQSLSANAEIDSLVQPGRQVYQLPPELPGTLRTIGSSLADPAANSGAFADVYQGEWECEGEATVTVAIKKVRIPGKNIGIDRFLTRLKRETVIWTTAKHPNILPFIGYQTVEEVPMLVSPWCQNGNLFVYTRSNPDLSRSAKVKLLCDAARGLLHLHDLKPQIVHGDIKPENVIVQDNLVAALCDFGISKVHDAGQHTGLTTSGHTGGTSGYQAKELLDDGIATPATDVYAFGGLILAAMSGYQPFYLKKQTQTIIAVYNDQTPEPKDHPNLSVDDPIWGLLRRCWKGVAAERPSMTTILEELEAQV